MLRLPGIGVYEHGRVPRPLRRARHPRLAGPDVREPGLPVRRRRLPGDSRPRGRRPRSTRLAARPSTAVLCGNSEIEQQVAMLGLDPDARPRSRSSATSLPGARRATPASTPSTSRPRRSAATCPFRPDRGVAQLLRRRRLPRARCRTRGRAASASPPSAWPSRTCPTRRRSPGLSRGRRRRRRPPPALEGRRPARRRLRLGLRRPARPLPRAAVRRRSRGRSAAATTTRYLELSRAVTGEVMADVFGEWRRAGSPSGGGMILWLRDLVRRRGLGRRRPPRRAQDRLSPPAPDPRADRGLARRRGARRRRRSTSRTTARPPLRRACGSRSTRTWSCRSAQAEARSSCRRTARPSRMSRPSSAGSSTQPGRSASGRRPRTSSSPAWSGTAPSGAELSPRRSTSRPAGRSRWSRSIVSGSTAIARVEGDGSVRLTVATRRLAYGVRIHVAGFAPSDDAFSVEPGASRDIRLRPAQAGQLFSGGDLTALNLLGRVPIRTPPP